MLNDDIIPLQRYVHSYNFIIDIAVCTGGIHYSRALRASRQQWRKHMVEKYLLLTQPLDGLSTTPNWMQSMEVMYYELQKYLSCHGSSYIVPHLSL